MQRSALVVKLSLAALLFAFALPSMAWGAVVELDIPQLAEQADSIVVAKVLKTNARKGDARRGGIERAPVVTDNRIVVSRVLKGSRPSEIVLTQPGGSLGEHTLAVSELPTFAPNERVILFLNDQGGILGGHQGKLRIVNGRVEELDMTLPQAEKHLESLAEKGDDPAGALVTVLHTAHISAAYEISSLVTETEPLSVETAASTVAPKISSISPTGANAGIGQRVTITGSGFKSSRGTGRVEFQHGGSLSGARIAAVTYDEWTDTRIVCVIPRRAQGGSVFVVNGDGAKSAGFGYAMGFSASGLKVGTLPIKYRIRENSADLTGEGAAIRAAFTTWNNAGSKFSVGYEGTCSSSANPPVKDGKNDIYFASTGFTDPNILGWNMYWYNSSKQIVESDIVLNDAYKWSNAPTSGQHDVQSVALHELGHTVGLDDQYAEFTKVMGAAITGKTRRSLHTAEVNGARYLYGATTTTTEPVPTSGTTSDSGKNAPKATSIGISAPAVSAYKKAKISGYLKDAGTGKGIPNVKVYVQHYVDGAWKTIKIATTSSSGYYSHVAAPSTRRTYRAKFRGTEAYASVTSAKRRVLPKVYLSTPAFRKTTTGTSLTSLRYGRTYVVNGTLKPRHSSGSKQIKIKAYRYEGGKWVYKKTYTTTCSNITGGSRYSVKIKLPKKGTWRVRAFHAEDTKNAKTYSAYQKVRVK